MSKQDSDQEARTALLGHYGSQLRYWGTILLTLAVAFFTVFEFKDLLKPMGLLELAFIILVMEIIYAFLRILYFGRLCELVLSAPPLQPENCTNLKRGEIATYLYRLDKGTISRYKSSIDGKFLYTFHSFKVWFIWTMLSLLLWKVLPFFTSWYIP